MLKHNQDWDEKPRGFHIFLYFFNRRGKEQVIYKHFLSFSRIHISLDYFFNVSVCSFIIRIDKLLSSFNFRYPKSYSKLNCLFPILPGEDAILSEGHG